MITKTELKNWFTSIGGTISDYQGILYMVTPSNQMIHIRSLWWYPKWYLFLMFKLHSDAFEYGGKVNYHLMITHIELHKISNPKIK